jgi:predicted SAM-dependent methyltransferase
MENKFLLLDLGCGTKDEWLKEEGWIHIDAYAPDAQVKAFIWDLPYEDNSVDEIYCSHVLEHFHKAQIIPTLQEWHRVIKPEGRIRILVPDLVWCCQWWLDHQTNGWDLDIIYGGQSREGEAHHTGFNRQIMLDYLKQVGLVCKKFEEMETHGQKTLSFECCK